MPTTPASRLPLKIARNHHATLVPPKRGGASFANRPRPVGRMYSSPQVRITKDGPSHAHLPPVPPARAPTPAVRTARQRGARGETEARRAALRGRHSTQKTHQ